MIFYGSHRGARAEDVMHLLKEILINRRWRKNEKSRVLYRFRNAILVLYFLCFSGECLICFRLRRSIGVEEGENKMMGPQNELHLLNVHVVETMS